MFCCVYYRRQLLEKDGWLTLGKAAAATLLGNLWYLLPMLTGGDLPGAVTVTLALAWFTAASVMHSVLAGLQSLPKGQYEAALTQGFAGKRCAWCCSRRRCATFSRRWWGSLSAC